MERTILWSTVLKFRKIELNFKMAGLLKNLFFISRVNSQHAKLENDLQISMVPSHLIIKTNLL